MRLKQVVLSLCILVLTVSVFSETLCLYVEERTNGEFGPFPPPTKEGIYYGLFDGNHIVFDMGDKNILNVNWGKQDFSSALNISLEGGARYFVAVKVNTKQVKSKERKVHVKTSASYYLYDARYSKLIVKGNIKGSNEGEENRINQSKLDFSLGEKIAGIVNRSIKEYVDKL
ncbi:MAG: hypothetical protein DRP57_01260 [Spirochaetes bacterium]|nr:MAG: hypothetical protein DRP57_01260 [Spirochaetota bacterium]